MQDIDLFRATSGRSYRVEDGRAVATDFCARDAFKFGRMTAPQLTTGFLQNSLLETLK
jgi:hypothetical protein